MAGPRMARRWRIIWRGRGRNCRRRPASRHGEIAVRTEVVTLAVVSFVAIALAFQASSAPDAQKLGVGDRRGDDRASALTGDEAVQICSGFATDSAAIRRAIDRSLDFDLYMPEPSDDVLVVFFAGATIESVQPFLDSDQLLQQAARYADDSNIVTFLIRSGFDPNKAYGPGIQQDHRPKLRTGPLHHAAQYNPNPDVIDALVRGGADVYADGGGQLYTPLHYAAHYNNGAVVSALIQNGARPDDINGQISTTFRRSPNNNGNTALHAAVFNSDARVIDVLVEAGADVEQRNVSGFAPLHFAVVDGRAESIATLVRRGADPNAVITPLVEEGDQIHDCTGCNPIHLLVNSLVDARDFDEDFDLAHWQNLLQVLLDAGADVNARSQSGLYGGYSALRLAVEAELGPKVVALLLESGARGEPESLHAVFEDSFQYSGKYAGANDDRAVGSADNLEVLDLLIEKGVDVNSRGRCGRTVLHQAAFLADRQDSGLERAVERVIAAGADVNVRSAASPEYCLEGGATPLHEAASGSTDSAYAIASILVNAGADPSIVDWGGKDRTGRGQQRTYERAA